MTELKNYKLKIINSAKTFKAVNFGCRVNSAEINQLSQLLIDLGLVSEPDNPDLYLINTCSITKKGETESLSRIRTLLREHPSAYVLATGCADLQKITHPHYLTLSNSDKEDLLTPLHSHYTPATQDTLGRFRRYLLKVQSGCSFTCSYCIVPQKRHYLWSLPIEDAINTVNVALTDGYQEIIITGVNLIQYQPGLSNLLEALLTKTAAPLISFGSLPLNCIDDKFLSLIENYKLKIDNYLHIPIQSGSDRILKLMHRPYDVKKIKDVFQKLSSLTPPILQGEVPEGRRGFELGTDIIVGFPTETDADFQDTYDLCQSIGFTKIHTFRYSPRTNTEAKTLFDSSPKIPNSEKSRRSKLIRSLTLLP